jgi:hypothetical protein
VGPDYCIANAIRCALDYGLTYVEGVAYHPPGKGMPANEYDSDRPVPSGLFRHAFCVDHEHEIVDTTYGYLGRRSVYLGYPVGAEEAQDVSPNTNSPVAADGFCAAVGRRRREDGLEMDEKEYAELIQKRNAAARKSLATGG